jgi:hypothetical protein
MDSASVAKNGQCCLDTNDRREKARRPAPRFFFVLP